MPDSFELIGERGTRPRLVRFYSRSRAYTISFWNAASLQDFQSFVILQLVELISLPLERRPNF